MLLSAGANNNPDTFDWFGFHQLFFGLEFSSEDERKTFRTLCLCSAII